MKTLFLISCSRHKDDRQREYPLRPRTITSLLSNDTAKEVIETRRSIRSLIANDRLLDYEQQTDSRGLDPGNKGVVSGPGAEFGESAAGRKYLPAVQRYTSPYGRFFREVERVGEEVGQYPQLWEAAWTAERETLIISGLFGVVHPKEPIQNYSCHLADRVGHDGPTLARIWRPVLTRVVVELAATRDIRAVVDLLSEDVYQAAVDWEIVRKAGLTCHHRCFRRAAGARMLRNLGRFFGRDVLLGDWNPSALECDAVISRPYFDGPDERLFFEPMVGFLGDAVAREGVLGEVGPLRRILSEVWEHLDNQVKAGLEQVEYKYQTQRHRVDVQHQGLCVEYCGVVEQWIKRALSNLRSAPVAGHLYDDCLRPRERVLALGGLAKWCRVLGERGAREPLRKELATLTPRLALKDFDMLANRLDQLDRHRRGLAHGEGTMSVQDFESLRAFGFDFLREWAAKLAATRSGALR